MVWLEHSGTPNVLDFISVAWGDLSSLKLLRELVFRRSHTVTFAFIRRDGAQHEMVVDMQST